MTPLPSKIAFVSTFTLGTTSTGAYLRTMDPDGTNTAELYDPVGVAWVRWSPDGTKLLISKFGLGFVLMNADGTGQTSFNGATGGLHGDRAIGGGDWSPDGTQFACPSSDGTEIQVLNIDGTLAATIAVPSVIFSGAGINNDQFWQNLVWFPDNSGFAFLGFDASTINNNVQTCALDGSGMTTILPCTAANDTWTVNDVYADSASLLVVHTDQTTHEGTILKATRDGAGTEVLYHDPSGTLVGGTNPSSGCALSPDESEIVVVCNDGTVRTMPAGGGALTTVNSDARAVPGSVDWGGPRPPTTGSIVAGAATSGIIPLP